MDNGTGVDGRGPDGGRALSFTCNEGESAPARALPRLSRTQYVNTLRDVLSTVIGDDAARSALARVESQLSSLPADTVTKTDAFARMDQSVSQQHVDSYFAVGNALANVLTESDGAVRALLGDCAGAGAGAAMDACVDSFVSRFGKLALRRPVSGDDLAFYREVYARPGQLDARGLSDVITVVLNAPEFLYHVEDQGTPVAGQTNVVALSGHEIAARLAYLFWDGPPDEELGAMAEGGSLGTEDGLREALDHVLTSPRATRALDAFVREWFGLDAMRPLDSLVGDPVFDAFAGDYVPSPDLKQDMIDDVLASMRYHALTQPGSFDEWFRSPYSFATSEELARIYGVAPWDGQSEPPRFADGERAGILTRAALLATGSANTRPIMKGVFIRTHLLCDAIPPPPANAAATPPMLSHDLTTREVVEELTERPGTACAACHTTQINALGFATEGFDALGRPRETQRLFDEDGSVIGEKPVDTSGIPRVWGDDERPVANVAELTERVLESGKAEACFARQYARFTLGREEDVNADGCLLEEVRSSLARGEPLMDAWARAALRPEFRTRVLPENP